MAGVGGVAVVAVVVAAVVVGFAAVAVAQTPDVPQGGGSCWSDTDCSLGGVCIAAGVCVCDAWFTGPTCAFLNLAPADSMSQGMCGIKGYHSWGGTTHPVPTNDGLYHGYFSFMCRHSSLQHWTTVSASVHVVGKSLVGPFEFADADCDGDVCRPAVAHPWSHNTAYARNAAPYHGTDAQELVFHVGDGVTPASDWYPCFNKSEADTVVTQADENIEQEERAENAKLNNGPFVSTAPSLIGPWQQQLLHINTTGSWATGGFAGNPAGFVHANGSVTMYFTATPCPNGSGALRQNCIGVATAPAWNETYQMHARPAPITYPESEDPFVFQDPRGNFHLLTNVNTGHARCAIGVPCGGHAWSTDGIMFSNLTIGAFGPVIRLTNGTYVQNSYIERPFVAQDPVTRVPLAFYGGLGRSSYLDCCSWAQLFCKKGQKGCGPTFPPANATAL